MNYKHIVIIIKDTEATNKGLKDGSLKKNEVFCRDIITGTVTYEGWDDTWFTEEHRKYFITNALEMAKQKGIDLNENDEPVLIYSTEGKDDRYYVAPGIDTFCSQSFCSQSMRDKDITLDLILARRASYRQLLIEKDKELGLT